MSLKLETVPKIIVLPVDRGKESSKGKFGGGINGLLNGGNAFCMGRPESAERHERRGGKLHDLSFFRCNPKKIPSVNCEPRKKAMKPQAERSSTKDPKLVREYVCTIPCLYLHIFRW